MLADRVKTVLGEAGEAVKPRRAGGSRARAAWRGNPKLGASPYSRSKQYGVSDSVVVLLLLVGADGELSSGSVGTPEAGTEQIKAHLRGALGEISSRSGANNLAKNRCCAESVRQTAPE